MSQHLKTGNTGIAREAHISKTNNTTSPVSQYSMGYDSNRFLQNVGKFLPDYITSHLARHITFTAITIRNSTIDVFLASRN